MTVTKEAEKETLLAGGMVRMFKDGDQWCALYGKDIQVGKVGFGTTQIAAVKELFTALGWSSNDVNWLHDQEPKVYLGGGVSTTLANAIVMMHCNERDAEHEMIVEDQAAEIERLREQVRTLADEADENETRAAYHDLNDRAEKAEKALEAERGHVEDERAWSLTVVEQRDDLAKKLAEAERKLKADLDICAQHMKNIHTWMPEGFKSHCTDAMMIMESRINDACVKRDDLAKKLAEAEKMSDSCKGFANVEIERQTARAEKAEATVKEWQHEVAKLRRELARFNERAKVDPLKAIREAKHDRGTAIDERNAERERANKAEAACAALREGLEAIKAKHEWNVCHCHSDQVWNPLLAANPAGAEMLEVIAAAKNLVAERRAYAIDLMADKKYAERAYDRLAEKVRALQGRKSSSFKKGGTT